MPTLRGFRWYTYVSLPIFRGLDARGGKNYEQAHTHTRDNHSNDNNNESTEVQTLGVIRIQLIYSINVLSKYSSLISHRPSIFEGRHIDLRRSTHQSPIFEGRHVDHRSSKVNTSISEGRHIDLQKSPHRRRSKAETSHLQFVTEYRP